MMTADQPHSPSRSYIERRKKHLRLKIAALTADYGEGFVRAEINRRPEPKQAGRPIVRDYLRMFTLWMVVEAAEKLVNGIGGACRLIEELGGIYEYRPPPSDEYQHISQIYKSSGSRNDSVASVLFIYV